MDFIGIVNQANLRLTASKSVSALTNMLAFFPLQKLQKTVTCFIIYNSEALVSQHIAQVFMEHYGFNTKQLCSIIMC